MKRFFSLLGKFFQRIFRRITISKEKPQILKDAGFDFYWDDSKLRAMELPTSDLDIGELLWNLDLPFWEEEIIDDWNLTPREVIENQKYHKHHYARIQQVDLSYPICIIKNREGRWFVLDGTHRLAKAYIDNQKIVKVKVVPSEKIAEIKKSIK